MSHHTRRMSAREEAAHATLRRPSRAEHVAVAATAACAALGPLMARPEVTALVRLGLSPLGGGL
jgi:hypothetical protein